MFRLQVTIIRQTFHHMLDDVTETCSKLHIIEYIFVFWVNDHFGYIQQHNGMALSTTKKLFFYCFEATPTNTYTAKRGRKSPLALHFLFSFECPRIERRDDKPRT